MIPFITYLNTKHHLISLEWLLCSFKFSFVVGYGCFIHCSTLLCDWVEEIYQVRVYDHFLTLTINKNARLMFPFIKEQYQVPHEEMGASMRLVTVVSCEHSQESRSKHSPIFFRQNRLKVWFVIYILPAYRKGRDVKKQKVRTGTTVKATTCLKLKPCAHNLLKCCNVQVHHTFAVLGGDGPCSVSSLKLKWWPTHSYTRTWKNDLIWE